MGRAGQDPDFGHGSALDLAVQDFEHLRGHVLLVPTDRPAGRPDELAEGDEVAVRRLRCDYVTFPFSRSASSSGGISSVGLNRTRIFARFRM